jgi:hypothetical protein
MRDYIDFVEIQKLIKLFIAYLCIGDGGSRYGRREIAVHEALVRLEALDHPIR